MKTDIQTLRKANWQKTLDDVVKRIAALHHVVIEMEDGPLSDKICNELILPAIAKLGSVWR